MSGGRPLRLPCRVRISLIERAIQKGVELQRRVERIEDEASRQAVAAEQPQLLLPPAISVPIVTEEDVQKGALAAARLGIWLEGGRSRRTSK